jgi:molybdenum cofactor synthesis domain-containing protein
MPDAEIIAVGSELLTPQRLDTNSLYLTDQLNALGVEVVRKTVVGDERERLTDSILGAAARSKIVVLTGGLGPTEDDLTRDAVAGALGRSLVFHQDICDRIEARLRISAARWRRSIGGRPTSSKAPRCCPTIAAPRRANGSRTTAWCSCCCPDRPWK